MGTEQSRGLTFEGCAGWLHPASGSIGVVMCSPWGYEELCMRRAWRMLADDVARRGYPTLRFDYPGTADSLGDPELLGGLGDLVGAAVKAGEALRDATGLRRLVFVGQGLGAVVAARAAGRIGADGVALLAPMVRGRDHLRELSVWGAMTAEAMHLSPQAGGVAGFKMPEALTQEVSAYDLSKLDAAPAAHVLIAGRPGRAGEARLAEALTGLGCRVQTTSYDGYDAAVGNPTAAKPPVATIEAVGDWLEASFPTMSLGQAHAEPATAASLEGDGFVETMVRFGPGGRLAGVVCEPAGERRGASVLMLSAGGDPHIGWARAGVDHARALARDGIASLRMDAADVGDSDGPLNGDAVRLYDTGHSDDAIRAVDWLEARGLGPVLPVGRCSGAFIAFNAAVRDARLADVLLINPQRFVWDRDGQMELAEDQVGHYQRAARDPKALVRRLLHGEIDVAAVAMKLGRAGLAVAQGVVAGHARKRKREIRASFRTLKDRGARVTMLFSAGGESHQAFAELFGEKGEGLAKSSDARIEFLHDADHGLTPEPSRAALLVLLRELASRPATPTSAVAAQDATARSEDLATRPAVLGGGLAQA